MTIKFSICKGHLNTILVPGGRNLNKPIFYSLNHRGVARGCVEVWNWSTYKSWGSAVYCWLKVELLSRSIIIKSVMFNDKWILFYGVRDNIWPNNLKMKQISSGYHSTFIFVHMYLRLRNLLYFSSSSCNLLHSDSELFTFLLSSSISLNRSLFWVFSGSSSSGSVWTCNFNFSPSFSALSSPVCSTK